MTYSRLEDVRGAGISQRTRRPYLVSLCQILLLPSHLVVFSRQRVGWGQSLNASIEGGTVEWGDGVEKEGRVGMRGRGGFLSAGRSIVGGEKAMSTVVVEDEGE